MNQISSLTTTSSTSGSSGDGEALRAYAGRRMPVVLKPWFNHE